MEKKGGRSVLSSTKGLGTDAKKNQDVAAGKQWPKGSRRREPPGGSSVPKSETSRKLPSQRNKSFDKRPRTRGLYNSGQTPGNEISRVEEPDEPELGSVFVQGSKKQSLNHLLNFHYAPREVQVNNGRSNKSGNKWLTTSKHKYNKEHFIQANCQFIVNSSGDYKQYMNNPDALVSWSLIEQVNLQVHELPSCPICLYPPVAAKMTRCGHIYCWSCMLHYLALSESTWSKCPICYESINKQDLKSVVPIPHKSFNINEMITFKLMKRARGSLVAYFFDEVIRDDTIFEMSDPQSSNVYCKLLLANKNDIMTIINREKHELCEQLCDEECSDENCFVEQALILLNERESVINSDLSIIKKTRMKSISDNVTDVIDMKSVDELTEESYDEASGLNNSLQSNKCHYFYQASDGQHIYLHAINVRMLEHTYGSLEFSPKTLTGRIVEKEGGSMTEELRKRLRYLQHLPVTCQFEVAEIHLHPPIISKETLDYFIDQVDLRKRKRQRRARDEKRREKRITEEENLQMGRFPTANLELQSHQQFPEFGSETTKNRGISESTSRSLSPISLNSESFSNEISPTLSFAKMLSNSQKPKPTMFLDLKRETPPPPRKLINVTGSKLNPVPVKKQNDSEPECEDYAPVPGYNRSFGDAISLAFEEAAKINADGPNSDTKFGKKKKKKKQKLLFATSMAYSGN